MICSRHTWRHAACAAILLPLALTLAACGGNVPRTSQSLVGTSPRTAQIGATPPPAASSTPVEVTATPSPTLSPTPIPPTATVTPLPPTATVAEETSLPAAVYFSAVGAGQVMRMERDGQTISQVTFEPWRMQGFDVAAGAGTITYVTGEGAGATLVALDGGGRRELFVGNVSAPRISPDGRTVVFRIDGQTAATRAFGNGVWSIPASGGTPSLVIADDSLKGLAPQDNAVWSYTPISYDKDGQRLLLGAYNIAMPGFPGGELVILNQKGAAPIRTSACCEVPVWSVDGSAITITGGGPGPDQRYGLYQIDAATGAEKALIAQANTSYPLVTGALQFLDGTTYAFYQDVSSDVFSWEYSFTPHMVRVAADGKITSLRQDSYPVSDVLWREDASGALIVGAGSPNGEAQTEMMHWLDASGSPAVVTSAVGFSPRWADSVRPIYAGDCSHLPQIAWQPAQSRVFSAGVADLQGRLNASGQNAGTPDGFFGDQTRTALHQFQTRRGLPLRDSLDCATWQELLRRT
jgi:Putative peptidoglycan binding domain